MGCLQQMILSLGSSGVGVDKASLFYGIQSTHSFASHSSTSISATKGLGTAHSDREIWVVVISMNPSSVLSVTIGGNSATKVREESPSGYTNQMVISYWKYADNGSLGTSAAISATLSESAIHSGLIVFTSSISYVLDFYGANANNSTPTVGSINTSSNGWSFYVASAQNASSGTISEFSGGSSFDMGTNEWVTYGFNSPENDGTVEINNPSGTSTDNVTITGLSIGSGGSGETVPSSFGMSFLQTELAVGSANTTHTFSNVNFGVEDANRWIFVTVHDGDGNIPTSVTIGGVTATAAITNGTNYQTCCIYYAKVPTGGSGNVVVTSSSNEKSIGVWRVVTEATNPVADSAFYAEGGSNATVNIPTGGAAIATNCYDNASGSIDTGTQRYAHDGGTSENVYGNDTVTTGTITFNGSGSDALSVVAISP